MRHVLSCLDLSVEESRRVFDIAFDLKKRMGAGERPAILERQVLGLLFEKPSLRTRVSFETLMHQTGGSSLFLGADVGWGKREPMRDFIPILSSYIDCLVIRAKKHDDVVQASQYSQCPVINGLTDYNHPCQAFADLMTIHELFGTFEGMKVAYVGDANNVAFSLGVLCNRMGVRFSIAAPKSYQFESEMASQLSAADDQLFEQTDDVQKAVSGAHAIYSDVWTSMGQESENEKRLKDFANYQVTEALFKSAAEGARFLHCLPARRGEEVASEVIDGPRSAVIQQAENRLHAQKGLVVWLLTEAQQ